MIWPRCMKCEVIRCQQASEWPDVEDAWMSLHGERLGEHKGIRTGLSLLVLVLYDWQTNKATERTNQSFKELDDQDAPHPKAPSPGKHFS